VLAQGAAAGGEGEEELLGLLREAQALAQEGPGIAPPVDAEIPDAAEEARPVLLPGQEAPAALGVRPVDFDEELFAYCDAPVQPCNYSRPSGRGPAPLRCWLTVRRGARACAVLASDSPWQHRPARECAGPCRGLQNDRQRPVSQAPPHA